MSNLQKVEDYLAGEICLFNQLKSFCSGNDLDASVIIIIVIIFQIKIIQTITIILSMNIIMII